MPTGGKKSRERGVSKSDVETVEVILAQEAKRMLWILLVLQLLWMQSC